jgi:hypothetical protein
LKEHDFARAAQPNLRTSKSLCFERPRISLAPLNPTRELRAASALKGHGFNHAATGANRDWL